MAPPIDLRPLIERVERLLAQRRLPGGGHAASPAGTVPDPYGCADALNLAWTLGDPLDHRSWADEGDVLAALQGDDGMWRDPTHHPTHTTAHCLGALELLGRRRPRPPLALHHLLDGGALERFLDELDWAVDPWSASHQGAGAWAALTLSGDATPSWSERWFRWMAAACDPATGLWRRGEVAPPPGWHSSFPQLAATFHYLFDHVHAGRPHPHPAALARTALHQLRTEAFPWATFAGFAEIDVVYCLHRAARQAGTWPLGRDDLVAFAHRYAAFADGLDLTDPRGGGDLHLLFGVVCCLAELSLAVPDLFTVERPLRLVLDRRPFI